jgi:DNA-damage-inducible protein J
MFISSTSILDVVGEVAFLPVPRGGVCAARICGGIALAQRYGLETGESYLATVARYDYIVTTGAIIMDVYVRARIDAKTKERAVAALAAMGLSVSDAIRLLMFRVADEQRLPFEVKVPNAETRRAMAELEAGGGKSFESVEALMADLDADD